MSLRDKLGAAVRGEVSTSDLNAFASAGSEAYDLLERIEAEGVPRLSAWCAFVLQTHADDLAASGSAPGYCEQEAYAEAQIRYQLAAGWLDRARTTMQSGDWKVGVVLPSPYPRPQGPQGIAELQAMRNALETVQTRLGADLEAQKGEPVYERLKPVLATVQSALDSALGLAGGREPSPELRPAIAQTLLDALDRAYQAGQVLAKPDLLASPQADPTPVAPVATGVAALTMFRPGDPGFDPWCLTDPIERTARQHDGVSASLLAEFWKANPGAEETLAIQAEIANALAAGVVDYVPNDLIGSLRPFCRRCPWPGVLWAKGGLTIGGQQLDEGDRFVLALGSSGGVVHGVIARLSAKAAADLSAE